MKNAESQTPKTAPSESGLPAVYAELWTTDCPKGRCQFISYINHRTPSGMDRPTAQQYSLKPVLTDGLISAFPPGFVYFLDNQRFTRSNDPAIPYSEADTPLEDQPNPPAP